MERISLNNMKSKESGNIVEFLGGVSFRDRLSSMGIRLGVKVTRVNSGFGKGAVVVRVGRAQTALGHGMSCKVIVEIER